MYIINDKFCLLSLQLFLFVKNCQFKMYKKQKITSNALSQTFVSNMYTSRKIHTDHKTDQKEPDPRERIPLSKTHTHLL